MFSPAPSLLAPWRPSFVSRGRHGQQAADGGEAEASTAPKCVLLRTTFSRLALKLAKAARDERLPFQGRTPVIADWELWNV